MHCPAGFWTVPAPGIICPMPQLFARESDHVVDTLREVAAPNKIKKVL